MAQQALDAQQAVIKTSDKEEYETIMTFQCQPKLTCLRFVALQNHMQNFFDGHPFRVIDFQRAKKSYDEEFWKHAPQELRTAKENLLDDPINHLIIDNYAEMLKVYKYQLRYPSYQLPQDPTEQRHEIQRIVDHINIQKPFMIVPR